MGILKEIHRLLYKIKKSKNIVNTEFTIIHLWFFDWITKYDPGLWKKLEGHLST